MTQVIPPDLARLFIALWPDQAIRDVLHARRESWIWPKSAHLAHLQSLHITLHFLGNVSLQKVPALIDALRVPFEPFDLTLNRQQVWPNGIAALEPSAIPPQMSALHCSLGKALQTMTIPIEARRYRPHVTFARRAAGAIVPENFPAIEWPVHGYTLMRSQLTPSLGYQVLQNYG